MTKENFEHLKDVTTALRDLTSQDFKDFGVRQIAYIRPFSNGIGIDYAVYGADGERIGVFESRDEAIVGTLQKDLEPVTIH